MITKLNNPKKMKQYNRGGVNRRTNKPSRSQGLINTLVDMLESIHLKAEVSSPEIFTAPWNLEIDSGSSRFYLLTQGECRLKISGQRYPIHLAHGDLIFLPGGSAHCLQRSSDQADTSNQAEKDSTTLMCGSFFPDEGEYEPLFSSLPPLIHIHSEDRKQQPGLEDLLRIITEESYSYKPGSQAIIDRLVHVLFIQTIRACSEGILTQIKDGSLLSGLMDPEIGQVIHCMNERPESAWTVAALAEKVYLSRSVFASRFTSLVGMPPLRYLHQCRMNKACTLLRKTQMGIKKIALTVGYSSEAAFSNAFKRWGGTPPGQYRDDFR